MKKPVWPREIPHYKDGSIGLAYPDGNGSYPDGDGARDPFDAALEGKEETA